MRSGASPSRRERGSWRDPASRFSRMRSTAWRSSASELDDSPGMIRPITLNVVGHVLSQGRATAPSLDAGRLVRHYIEQSVEQPAIREFAPRVLKELVTEQGTKWPRSEKELVDQTRLRPGEVRAVMNGLWAAALARPLDAAQGVWELSHDFVARAVARYLGRRRLDWPGLTRAFAAPALFVLMAAAAAGAIAWNVNAADRARARLADLGFDISADGLEGAASSRFKVENWATAGSLLSKQKALQSLNLTSTPIADGSRQSGPRAAEGATALQSLNLSSTQVADLGWRKARPGSNMRRSTRAIERNGVANSRLPGSVEPSSKRSCRVPQFGLADTHQG